MTGDVGMAAANYEKGMEQDSTEVQNPRRKMQVALFAEPKTPLESSLSIIIL